MEKVRFGIIGCGLIADIHARALTEITGACISGFTDVRIQSAERFAEKYGTKVFTNTTEMFNSSDVDAVCICTPSGLHAPLALTAAEHGKHIVLEKPMGLTTKECDEIIKAVDENNVKLTVISQLRFSPSVIAVKQALSDGLIGVPVAGNVSMKYYRTADYFNSSSWKGTYKMDGGGALMNQGIHGIDLLLYLMGDVRDVYGVKRTLIHNIEVEDTAAAVLVYENGALGTLIGTTSVYPGEARKLELCGSRGMITLEEDVIVKWECDKPKPEIPFTFQNNSSSDPSGIGILGHILQLTDFIAAIQENRSPRVTGADGRRAVELIERIYACNT